MSEDKWIRFGLALGTAEESRVHGLWLAGAPVRMAMDGEFGIETLANGDKIHVTYTFEGTSKDKAFQTGSNKWTFVGGTGMMKGAKGSGTCKAKGTPDGGIAFECSGTYTLAQ